MMLESYSIRELVEKAGAARIAQIVLEDQAERDNVPESALLEEMEMSLVVMRDAVRDGLKEDLHSVSRLTGGQAYQYRQWVESGASVSGSFVGRAAPTAGACGVVPGVLITMQEERQLADDAIVMALFTAAGVGRVIAKRASISGAEGGCQAEIGAAAAMAAACLVELAGGAPDRIEAAVALALMNLMGLVCDPVMGLVEVPCVYRNVAGVSVAITAADMALAGIRPILPADEVIDAMGRVGQMLPTALRETGEGGCASCPSARKR